jgi:RAB protein geranylgeranyltransferase component A
MDDFTLPSTDWDVLVSGTGVKPSLLAAALSRAGKRVLQVDNNAYYGASEAAFSLDELEKWAASLPPDCSFSNASTERRAEIRRPRSYTLTLAPHLVYWSSNLLELLREAEMTSAFGWQAVGGWWVYLTDEDVARRPEEGGSIGGALVDAGVKAIKAGGTVRRKAGWNKGRKAASVDLGGLTEPQLQTASTPTLRKLGGVLREVPSTFEDVAWSPDLQDRDRGYLGGFLRFVTKCSDPQDTKHHQLLLDNADTPLSEFLSTVYPLPPFTIASIHSLTLLPTPPEETKLREAVQALTTHVQSTGRIPDIRSAAALTIEYGGSAELCQVWSRGAAVAGGINVLSCGVESIVPSTPEEKITINLTTGTAVTADWVLTTPAPTPQDAGTFTLTKGIHILTSPLSSLFTKKFPDDRIAPNAVVLTFPTNSLSTESGEHNSAPIYIIAHSAATGECEQGECECLPRIPHPYIPGNFLAYFDLTGVLYTSTSHPVPSGHILSALAVSRTLAAAGEGGSGAQVSFVCNYSQTFPVQVTTTTAEKMVQLSPMSGDLAFDKTAVEECRSVYESIMRGGSGHGFLAMTEEMKRQHALAEEEE